MTTMGGAVSPAAVLNYSSRFEFVGAKNCVAEFAERQTKLDVVKGQGYFACHAGGREFESHLVQSGASSSVVEHLMSLTGCSRPAIFERKEEVANGKNECVEAHLSRAHS